MRLPITILLFSLLAHNVYLQSLNCYVPADIMILLDGSDSIQDRDWDRMKEFVQLLIKNFDVAQDAIHIGLVVYSSVIGDHIGLNSFKDKIRLQLLAGALNHPKASTNTARGIEYVREKFKVDGRPGVPKIAIVITDGSSDNPRETARQGNLAKQEGIKVLAVGVGGQMFRDELRQIASKPSKVFTSPTFGTLVTLTSEIRQMVCQVITTTTTTTTTPKIPTRPPIVVPVPTGRVCDVPGDVVFLMDGSDSINDADFIRQKAFVANMIDNFEIGSEYIHVGMIVYSTMIGETVGLQPPKSKALLKILAKSLKHPKVGTNTARGIERVRKMMRAEGRSFAPKLAVVITDGRSTNPSQTIAQANLAKVEGITMIAIGVGTEIFRDELRQIANTPRQVFEVSDFRDLERIIAAMRDLICQEIKTTTTTTTTTEPPTTPPPYVPPPAGLICNVPADIGFLLDGSDSIDDKGWIREKNFAANLINNLDIGPDTIHAGIVVYSTLIGETINLTPFKPKTLLKIMARNLKHPKVGTNTARGIERMRTMFRTQGRPNAPKVMIIVTDGRSRSPSQTIQQAALAKQEGIIVIAVGVGTQVFRDELRQMATNERKLFEVSDFAALQQIIVAIRDLICQVITTTTTMEITTTTMPPVTTLHPIPECEVPAEIVFLTHGSDNIDESSWNKHKSFLSNMIKNMYVGANTHHIGYIVYSQSVVDHIGLQPFKNKFDLQNFANGLIHPGHGTDTAAGLQKLREVFRHQGRPSAPKIGVLITDNMSNKPDLAKVEADIAKVEGVTLFTVGVGNNVNTEELNNLASSNQQVIKVPSYDRLDSVIPDLRHLICEAIQKPPPPVTVPPPTFNFTNLCAGCLFDKGTGFNPFPGDCGKYVQCWIHMGEIRGVVKSCPFGQFWDADAVACRPSMNVHCKQDPCLDAPNGFTYSMSDKGCRAYWVCLNYHSIGSCCPVGSYYVEGMGCMRGMACNEPCPPDGGIIVTPSCNKEASWDERYYIQLVHNMGKVVRPCSAGTRFSKAYCMCVANVDGLIPSLPGEKCRPSAYLPFDFDLKDKSERKTKVTSRNMRLTPYGTAHFTGDSALNMYEFSNAGLGNKLFIRFNFKFDRWGEDFDYGGLIVDMGKGESHWRWDIDSGWTRNITIGGGWDAEKLMHMFRRLFSAPTEADMHRIMIEIANSPDFKALLYQLGFIPNASNGLQILRILLSGHGSSLIGQILQQLGNVKGAEDVRKLLFNLLQIEGMSKFIRDHTGKNHGLALKNWRKFLNSLTIKGNNWNKGNEWMMGWDIDLHGGDMASRAKLIADLWRIFVNDTGMNTKDWKRILKLTFTNDVGGDSQSGYINVDLMNEIQGALKRNGTINHLWKDFLNARNISVTWFHNGGSDDHIGPGTIDNWLDWFVKHGHKDSIRHFDWTGGSNTNAGFTDSGIKHMADVWREFVVDTHLDHDGTHNDLLKWTYIDKSGTNGPQHNNLLIKEIKDVLLNDTVRNKFTDFLTRHNISILATQGGWDLVKGNTNSDVASWVYWLYNTFQDNNQSQGGGGHEPTFWDYLFAINGGYDGILNGVNEGGWWGPGGLNPDWLFGGHWNGAGDTRLPGQGGTWGTNQGVGGNTGVSMDYAGFTSTGINTISDLWRKFIKQSNLNPQIWGSVLKWTLSANTGPGGAQRHWLLLEEMRNVLSDDALRDSWLNFLTKHGYNIVLTANGWDLVKGGVNNDFASFIYWLITTVDVINNNSLNTNLPHLSQFNWDGIFGSGSGGSGGNTGFHNSFLNHFGSDSSFGFTTSGIKRIAELWRHFISNQNLDRNKWGNTLVWTLRGTNQNANAHGISQNYLNNFLLISEMYGILSNEILQTKWLQYLKTQNIGIVWTNMGWDVQQMQNADNRPWVQWLLNLNVGGRVSGSSQWAVNNFGFTPNGLKRIATLWKTFIGGLHLDNSKWGTILKWSHGTQNSNQNIMNTYLLITEMKGVLSDKALRKKWFAFLNGQNIGIVLTQNGWDVKMIQNADNTAWVKWLLGLDTSGKGHNGLGFTANGLKRITDLWRSFITSLNLDAAVWGHVLCWTNSGSGNTHSNANMREMYNFYLMILEMHGILSDVTLRSKWLEFLTSRNYAIVLTADGWDVLHDHVADNNLWVTWLLRSLAYTDGWMLPGIGIGGTDLVHPIHLGGNRIDSVFRHDFISGLFGNSGGSSSGGTSASGSGGTSIESLESILNSLVAGFGGDSGSSSSAIDSTENTYMQSGSGCCGQTGWWDGNSGITDYDLFAASLASSEEFYRKKRSAENNRKKRAAKTQFDYESLVGNCQRNGPTPSVDISANERNVRMQIMTEGKDTPTTLNLPIIPGWNEVTLAYDGARLHGIVENWRGKRHIEAHVSGNIQKRSEGISLGSCDLHHNFRGQIDDFILYQCIPHAVKRGLGTT